MFLDIKEKVQKFIEKHALLSNKTRWLSLALVLMFLLQLVLPIGLVNATKETDTLADIQTSEVEIKEDSSDTSDQSSILELKKEDEAEVEGEKEAPKSEETKKSESSDSTAPPKQSEEKKKTDSESKKEPDTTQEADQEEPQDSTEELVEEEIVEEEIDIPVGPEDTYAGDGIDPALILGVTPLIRFGKGSLGAALAKGIAPTDRARIGKGSLGAALAKGIAPTDRARSGELAPGEVRTTKEATRVPGKVNTWDIEVHIEGRDEETIETTDVVLVIDRSGSMAGQRLTDAKNAANKFIDKMIDLDPNLRIALVSYSSNYQGAQLVTVESQFSRNKSTLRGKVNALTALGGTHTQAGIYQGDILMNASTADNRYMVLLSDGEPTFSYKPLNWETRNERLPGSFGNMDRGMFDYQNRYGIYDGAYDATTVVGNGNRLASSTTEYENRVWPYITGGTSYYPLNRTGSGAWNNPYKYSAKNLDYIDNGKAAIQAGTEVKAKSYTNGLYTIAVAAGVEGTAILGEIASPGKAYSTDDSAELEEIYEQIAGEISIRSAITDAKITDEMGDGFTLVDGTIVTTQGTTQVAAATSTTNQTITWDIPSKVDTLKPGSTNVRFAKMTYRVEINPDILTAPVATAGETAEHDLFKTNKSTLFNYKDSDNALQEKTIASPEVDPVLLKIKKTLKDELGNVINEDPRLFNVQITNGGSGFNDTINLGGGAGYTTLTTLRQEGTYNVEEIGITGDGVTDLGSFLITYDINGTETTEFLVNHEGEIPRGDVVIEVTNTAIQQVIDFTFTKKDGSGEPLLGAMFTLEKQGAPEGTALIDNSGVDPVFTFIDLTEGTYILKETKAPTGYKLPTNTWTITVVRNETTGLLEIQLPDDSFLTSVPEGFEVENEEQSEFPKTGGMGSLAYIGMGLTILMGSVGLYEFKKTKNEEKEW